MTGVGQHPMTRGIPPVGDLWHLFSDERACTQFLLDNGALYGERTCPGCGREMALHLGEKEFRCGKKGCRRKIALTRNSFFWKRKLSCSQMLHLGYLWVCRVSPSSAAAVTAHCRQTIADFYGYFRQLVSSYARSEDTRIGGEGVIVELDECKLGKRKFNRGHHVEGVWILGGIERTVSKRTFFVPVEDRSAQTLLPLIRDHVLPGSIVYTDLWRGYSRISEELGLLHFTVNHSETFVDPVTGVHTNTIEGSWNGLKLCINPRNRVLEGMADRLGAHQWFKTNRVDRWNAFITCLRDIHYD
jgi:transposase-like protein